MGSGVCCINPLTIIQTAQGLATYLQEQFDASELTSRGVAVGYDHRENFFFLDVLFALVLCYAVFIFKFADAEVAGPFDYVSLDCRQVW